MRAAARGAPLKANFFPYDKSLFVLMGAPNIKRVQDLKGKVIGTTGPGATTEVAASMVLQHHGMDPRKDVTFMTIGGAETSVVAMRNGIIHARAFNPDAAYIMKKQGFTELGVLADMGPWPWAGYSTSDAHLANRRDKLKRWTRAIGEKPATHAHAKRRRLINSPRPISPTRATSSKARATSASKPSTRKIPAAPPTTPCARNIDLTITQPLKLPASPPLAQLVDFSLAAGNSQRDCRLRGESSAPIHRLDHQRP
jgi:hypothetical protein